MHHYYLLFRLSPHFMDARLWDRRGALWLSSSTCAASPAETGPSLSTQLLHLWPQTSTFRSRHLQVGWREALFHSVSHMKNLVLSPTVFKIIFKLLTPLSTDANCPSRNPLGKWNTTTCSPRMFGGREKRAHNLFTILFMPITLTN